MPYAIATLFTLVGQMLAAMSASGNQIRVSARGGDEQFLSAGQAKLEELERLNAQQERLKAELKLKTAEVEASLKGMSDWYSQAKQIVKLAYHDEQEKWIEFGVTTKK